MTGRRGDRGGEIGIGTPRELVAAIEEEVGAAGVSLRRQVDALEELHSLFTSERSRARGLSYLDIPKFRNAYLRYHLPLNVARAECVIREILAASPAAAALPTVVDLGAGPGSASIATSLALPPLEGVEAGSGARTYILRDRSRAALRIGARILARLAPRERVVTSAGPIVSGSSRGGRGGRGRSPAPLRIPPRSLVWLSMVLNELGSGGRRRWLGEGLGEGPGEGTSGHGGEARDGRDAGDEGSRGRDAGAGEPAGERVDRGGLDPERILEGLARDLEPPSIVAIIEPALRGPGRDLLRLHDAAIAAGDWRVLGPCTHQLRCPLLRLHDRPWCHFHFRWDAPPFVRAVADPLGLECEESSLAFLILERAEAAEHVRESSGKNVKGAESAKGPENVDGAKGAEPAGLARAIGDRMPVQGGGEGIYLCRDGERSLLVDPPTGTRRGDVVRLGPEGRVPASGPGSLPGRLRSRIPGGVPGGRASIVRAWGSAGQRGGETPRAGAGDSPPLDGLPAER